MSRIKPFQIEFIDPDTMKLVDTQSGNIQVFTNKNGNLSAFLIDDEVPHGMKQLLIKKVDERSIDNIELKSKSMYWDD